MRFDTKIGDMSYIHTTIESLLTFCGTFDRSKLSHGQNLCMKFFLVGTLPQETASAPQLTVAMAVEPEMSTI